VKAKDIMNPVTVFLHPDDTLQQAVLKLRIEKNREDSGINGMVVLDDQKKIVGVLSIKDILRATIPVYLDLKIAQFSWDGMLEKMAQQVACRKVKEFMSSDVVTVSQDTPLMVCTDLLIQKSLQRLPVVDEAARVVGIVRIDDIYTVISKILINQPECRA